MIMNNGSLEKMKATLLELTIKKIGLPTKYIRDIKVNNAFILNSRLQAEFIFIFKDNNNLSLMGINTEYNDMDVSIISISIGHRIGKFYPSSLGIGAMCPISILDTEWIDRVIQLWNV